MTGQPSILLVIHDPLLRRSLSEHLAAVLGAGISHAEPDAVLVEAEAHHLIILDADADGPRLSRVLRESRIATPVLSLGAADAHADAVMAKPLRLGALAAKATELMARRPAPIRLGPWRLEPERRLLLSEGGRLIRLTDKETAILTHLHQARGKVVERDVLLSDIWGYGGGIDTHTLETHVYRLRRKLAPSGLAERLVNEDGGYRLADPDL